ncbi:uncharacterized protein LOC132615267 [Lycium barbarum]|uniref:uncharacterized protein LOC132615267 n=1 Tax=Lycium barbarum TaxID=112863 RepID=UPI00293F3B46|nr:uncharacterized protein LOC132615267 [Lycium barbarum]
MSTGDLYDTKETRNMPSEASASNSTGNDFDHDHNNKNEDRQLDPWLVELLESLREIYMKRSELFKKMNYEEPVEVLKKLKVAIRKKKKLKTQTTIKRSLSVGDEMRHERFKIKTPVVIVAGPKGQGGQDKNGSN